MQTIFELGEALAARRKELRLKQIDVASMAGMAPAMLSRFENSRLSEIGSRKLLALLGVMGMELAFVTTTSTGQLDELLVERRRAR